eukprot:SAG31_NODE_864_length_11392_cov_21.929868_10_plen_162_part_00
MSRATQIRDTESPAMISTSSGVPVLNYPGQRRMNSLGVRGGGWRAGAAAGGPSTVRTVCHFLSRFRRQKRMNRSKETLIEKVSGPVGPSRARQRPARRAGACGAAGRARSARARAGGGAKQGPARGTVRRPSRQIGAAARRRGSPLSCCTFRWSSAGPPEN